VNALGLLHYWRRSLAVLLLVQFVNLSIDLPDQLVYRRISAIYGLENLAINEMESLLEVAVELGCETPDAFPEHNEHDIEDFKRGHVMAWHPSLVFYGYLGSCFVLLPDLHAGRTLGAVQSIHSPPPEAGLA
jgi:hypothetical protein